MTTESKRDLLKEIKYLKDQIRSLRNENKTLSQEFNDLPIKSFCFLKDNEGVKRIDISLNLETKQIQIMDIKLVSTTLDVGIFKAKKDLVLYLMDIKE